MSNRHYIFGLIAAVLLGIIFLLLWNRNGTREDWPTVNPTPAETELAHIVTSDSLARLSYQRNTAMLDAANKALKRELADLKAQLSDKALKAQHSAQEYQKTPTLGNCHQALTDCHEESETKSGVIAVQDRMLAAADSSQRKDRKEIARSYGVADSLATGWDKANKALRVEKGKKWALTVQAGYGIGPKGTQPAVSVGVSRILWKF